MAGMLVVAVKSIIAQNGWHELCICTMLPAESVRKRKCWWG